MNCQAWQWRVDDLGLSFNYAEVIQSTLSNNIEICHYINNHALRQQHPKKKVNIIGDTSHYQCIKFSSLLHLVKSFVSKETQQIESSH